MLVYLIGGWVNIQVNITMVICIMCCPWKCVTPWQLQEDLLHTYSMKQHNKIRTASHLDVVR